MELVLPESIGTRDTQSLYSLCGKVLQTDAEQIILNAQKVRFIDPLGLSVLGALISSHPQKKFSMPWMGPEVAAYMERMDFFKHFEFPDVEVPGRARTDQQFGLVELTCVREGRESEAVANRLANAITGVLTNSTPTVLHDMDSQNGQFERFRYPIWYSLSELIENALTHAKRDGHLGVAVWVAAQYYRTSGIVRLAVVDNGCGVLHTLKNHIAVQEKTHLAAIRAALEPKVSCNRDLPFNEHGNQGVGLTTTSRIARAGQGGLLIASGDSLFQTQGKVGSLLGHGGHWKGTAIAFHCRRKSLPSIRVGGLLPPEPNLVPVAFVDE
jgi:anti-anti-sigma regulatory factor